MSANKIASNNNDNVMDGVVKAEELINNDVKSNVSGEDGVAVSVNFIDSDIKETMPVMPESINVKQETIEDLRKMYDEAKKDIKAEETKDKEVKECINQAIVYPTTKQSYNNEIIDITPIKKCPMSILDDTCSMFEPERSERDGWLIKARFIKPYFVKDNTWERRYNVARDVQASIRTGIKYDKAFKLPHIIKSVPELVDKYGIRIEPSVPINGELVINIYIHNNAIQLKQGDIIAEIVFP